MKRVQHPPEEQDEEEQNRDNLYYLYDFITFGDSAYKRRSHLRSYFKVSSYDNNLSQEDKEHLKDWNYRMKSIRISIEWNYGTTASLFKYLRNQEKLKLLKNSNVVSKVYCVATLLRNCYAGLYGVQTNAYFGVNLPVDFIEHYLEQRDFQ